MVRDGDVAWAGGATRVAKTLGVPGRADVQAIVDDANAQTAVLRNQVIGTQANDVLRDPTRLHESAMGNMVADAMRGKYPGIDAAYTNSGGLRQDLVCSPPSAGEAAVRDHLGRDVRGAAVRQPHRHPHPHRRPAPQAFLNGFSPVCNPSIATGRFPQVSGLRATFHCEGTTPVVDGMWKTPDGIGGHADADRRRRLGAARDQRLHVHRR